MFGYMFFCGKFPVISVKRVDGATKNVYIITVTKL